jgi:hypothetical protein
MPKTEKIVLKMLEYKTIVNGCRSALPYILSLILIIAEKKLPKTQMMNP